MRGHSPPQVKICCLIIFEVQPPCPFVEAPPPKHAFLLQISVGRLIKPPVLYVAPWVRRQTANTSAMPFRIEERCQSSDPMHTRKVHEQFAHAGNGPRIVHIISIDPCKHLTGSHPESQIDGFVWPYAL